MSCCLSQAIQKQIQRYETAQARAQAAYAAKPRRTKCIFTQEMMLKEACGTEVRRLRMGGPRATTSKP